MLLSILGGAALLLPLGALLPTGESDAASKGTIDKAPFGTAPDGTPVDIYTLRNANGVEARICTYGGIIVSFKVPDRNGKMDDVVLGYNNLDEYIKDSPYFGAIVGRYGNRIAKGKFTLDGKEYKLATNNGENALHGGIKGFDKVVWNATPSITEAGPTLTLTYTSKDGEEGYPGNLSVTATYTLTADNAIKLDYTATTDKPTVCNITQHSYFNLSGKGDILDHQVMINADKFTPVDSGLIPTGELRPVEGTPFDFRTSHAIGERIEDDDEQLKLGGGYDHNFIINKPLGELGLAARVTDPKSGRVLEVFTTEPGMQFYTGNFLESSLPGFHGKPSGRRSAFAMEPQHYPDSPNKPQFPSVVLCPGETYKNTIIFRLSVEK